MRCCRGRACERPVVSIAPAEVTAVGVVAGCVAVAASLVAGTATVPLVGASSTWLTVAGEPTTTVFTAIVLPITAGSTTARLIAAAVGGPFEL
ncbi:hypothetical protein [Kibdelosporangium philippinense]|uniref:hypothetical protein n=1 Tax=Kibdelosporangium philippinense TaxID=211113 RepID=UPI003608164D